MGEFSAPRKALPTPQALPHRSVSWWLWAATGATRRRDLRAPIMAAVAFAATMTVGLLLDGVRENADLAAYDPAVAAAFDDARRPWLTAFAQAATFLGSAPWLVALVIVALIAVGVIRHDWRSALAIASAMASATLLTVVLKTVVGRPRPPAGTMLGTVDLSPAFPSGHTLNATVFYGLVGLIAIRRPGRWALTYVIAAWLTLIGVIGLSRVYLGYHWMTDVMAGWLTGVAVLAVTIAVSTSLSPIRDESAPTAPAAGQ